MLVALLAVEPLAAQGTYGGPSVLSRGSAGALSSSSDLMVLQPSLQLLGTYESGLYLPSVDSFGRQAGGGSSFGATAVGSLNGYRRWRHTVVGVNYQGSFRHYTRNRYMDGIDQILALNVQRQVSARTAFGLTGAGGTYSRGYGWGGMQGSALNYGDYSHGPDPTLSLLPQTDLLDTRTYYAAGGVDLVHRKTARLSFSMGGSAFAVRRRAKGLVELNGYTVRGDIVHRVSRNATLGVDYSFNSFQFVRGFGASDFHIVAANLSTRLDRNWTFSLRGGGFRLENLRSVVVQLDPAVAALLGQSSGIEAFYKINYGTVIGAGLSRNFRRAGLTIRFDRGITPGNGVLLTSRRDNVGAAYSYHGWRRWSLTFNVDGTRMATTFQGVGGVYKHYTAGAGTSYRISRRLHLVGHSGWRRFDLAGRTGGRNSYFVSAGLGFTPREMPLSFR